MEELRNIFLKIKDPRDNRGKRHNLVDIIIISVCGILCGCIDFEDIVDYAKGKKEFFEEHLYLLNGIPSAKTFREVFKVIKAEDFLRCFMEWVKTIIPESNGQHIIIDGKAVRAATEKVKKGKIPYIVNAYMAGIGLTISQIKVEEKTNEITAIPKILDMIAIKGAVITIDAIGTQEKIMDKIVADGGKFILPIKMNQQGAYKEISEYFDQLDYKDENIESSKKTYDKSHGRLEIRECVVSKDVKWFNNINKWRHVKSIARTTNHREIDGKKTVQVKFYVSSAELSAEEICKLTRNHWQIENNLHWVLDVTFNEDLSRGRKDNLMENFSLLRKMCLNIIKKDERFGKISIKRKMNQYKFKENAFEDLIFNIIPNMQLN